MVDGNFFSTNFDALRVKRHAVLGYIIFYSITTYYSIIFTDTFKLKTFTYKVYLCLCIHDSHAWMS